MTREGYAKLINHEGEKLSAYQDSLGWWTIGIGHLIDARKGGSIPQRISRELFEDDVAVKTVQARIAFPWFDWLNPVRQDAIVNLTFNLGIDGLKKFRLMIAAIEKQEWHQAAFELNNSLWAKQVQRQRVVDLTYAIEKGEWPDLAV